MKPLTNALKQMLDGLAHAHVGDYLSTRQKTEILSDTQTAVVAETLAPVTQAERPRNAKRIAMYMGRELPPEVMDYVIQTCSRLQHGLTVLTFETRAMATTLLQPYQDVLQAANIDVQVEALAGEPIPRLARYLRGHPEIAFMACKDSGYLGRGFVNGSQRKSALPVPVVVVVSQQEAAQNQTDTTANKTDQQTGVA